MIVTTRDRAFERINAHAGRPSPPYPVTAWVDQRTISGRREAFPINRLAVPNRTLISQPEMGGQAQEVIEAIVRSGQVSLLVVDKPCTHPFDLDDPVSREELHRRFWQKMCRLAKQTGCQIILVDPEYPDYLPPHTIDP